MRVNLYIIRSSFYIRVCPCVRVHVVSRSPSGPMEITASRSTGSGRRKDPRRTSHGGRGRPIVQVPRGWTDPDTRELCSRDDYTFMIRDRAHSAFAEPREPRNASRILTSAVPDDHTIYLAVDRACDKICFVDFVSISASVKNNGLTNFYENRKSK